MDTKSIINWTKIVNDATSESPKTVAPAHHDTSAMNMNVPVQEDFASFFKKHMETLTGANEPAIDVDQARDHGISEKLIRAASKFVAKDCTNTHLIQRTANEYGVDYKHLYDLLNGNWANLPLSGMYYSEGVLKHKKKV